MFKLLALSATGPVAQHSSGFKQIPQVAGVQERDVAARFDSAAARMVQHLSETLAGVGGANEHTVGLGERFSSLWNGVDCLSRCYFLLSSRSAFRWSWAGFIFAP
ncbi:MAG: hypothetical protein ACYDAE_20020 [Steroidobacteraceae bacterium]